jgi:hypothetical protein
LFLTAALFDRASGYERNGADKKSTWVDEIRMDVKKI